MTSNRDPIVGTIAFLLVVSAAAAILVVVAPEEGSLGPGIKSVYVHVSLTLTGVLGLVIAGALGLSCLVTAHAGIHRWMLSVGRVGLLFYAAGVAASVVAARITWGGVFLGEPILRASLLLVGVGLLAHLLMPFFSDARVHAALSVAPALALIVLVTRTVLVMHPRGSVVRTAPVSMQLVFAGTTILFLLAAARISWHVRHRGARR